MRVLQLGKLEDDTKIWRRTADKWKKKGVTELSDRLGSLLYLRVVGRGWGATGGKKETKSLKNFDFKAFRLNNLLNTFFVCGSVN